MGGRPGVELGRPRVLLHEREEIVVDGPKAEQLASAVQRYRLGVIEVPVPVNGHTSFAGKKIRVIVFTDDAPKANYAGWSGPWVLGLLAVAAVLQSQAARPVLRVAGDDPPTND